MAIYCERADIKCWNHAEVDLPALRDRLGAPIIDWPISSPGRCAASAAHVGRGRESGCSRDIPAAGTL